MTTTPSPRHAPVFQHEARAARFADAVAEIVGGGPRVGADPHLVEGARAAAAHHRREQARVLIADHGAEPLHRAGIHRERLVAAEAGRELHAPQFGGTERDALFEFGDEGTGRLLQQRHQLAAARRRYPLRRLAALLRLRPILDGGAGDGENVAARLLRHRPGACEPLLNPARAGIVGGGRQSQIAELVAQLVQKLRRFGQRLHRIEGIEQAALARGSRHELRNPLRALAAARHRPDRVRAEAALLPDHAREEFQRKVRSPGRRFDHQAHRLARVAFARLHRPASGVLDRVASPASSAMACANEDKSDTVHQRARRYRTFCMAVCGQKCVRCGQSVGQTIMVCLRIHPGCGTPAFAR